MDGKSLEDVAKIAGGLVLNQNKELKIQRVMVSLTNVEAGDLYVPASIAPSRHQEFADKAISKGAVGVISEDGLVSGSYPIIVVSSMNEALQKLAQHNRAAFHGVLIGITGSVGKTTTKDMLAFVLSQSGPTHSTMFNLNTCKSNSAAVASIPLESSYSVLEISLFGPGAVRRKSAIAKPDIAIITSIGLSHSERQYQGDDSIVNEKTEIFFELTSNGIAVLPSGDKKYISMLERARESEQVKRIISCGEAETDDIRLIAMKLFPTYSEVTVNVAGALVHYVIGQPGAHFVRNSLLVAGVLHATGADLKTLGQLINFSSTKRRVERLRVELSGKIVIELIDDAYNSAPDSVKALLEVIKLRKLSTRKVLILGDMLELGADEVKHHLDLAAFVEHAKIDLLLTVGSKSALVGNTVKNIEVIKFDDVDAAAKQIISLLRHRDLVAVKGSNGVGLVKIVNTIRNKSIGITAADYRWSIEVEPRRSKVFIQRFIKALFAFPLSLRGR